MGNLIGDANTKGNPWEGLGKNYKAVVQSSEVAVLLFPGTCHLIMQLPLRWRQNPSYWEGPFRDHFKNQVFISRSWWWNRPTQQRKISSQRLLVCLALSKYWRKKKNRFSLCCFYQMRTRHLQTRGLKFSHTIPSLSDKGDAIYTVCN